MTDIEAAAAGLTEAQRRALASSRQDDINKLPRVFDRGIVRKALRDRGLAHGDLCYLTPLGQQVRALLSQDRADG